MTEQEIATPEGHGAIVIDAWCPLILLGSNGIDATPVLLIDGDVVARDWGRVHVTVPAGSHSVLAIGDEPQSCERVMVGAGEVIHLEYARAFTMSTLTGRIVPPGSRPPGFPATIAFYMFCQTLGAVLLTGLLTFMAAGLWSLLVTVIRFPSLRIIGSAWFNPLLGWFSLGMGLLALIWMVISPRGFRRRLRSAAVRARRKQTLRAMAAASSADPPARFLGDSTKRPVPQPLPGQAAVRLHATFSTGPGTLSPSQEPAFRDLPRIPGRRLTVQVNDHDVPADWSTWWYPVPAGRTTVRITHPIPAELELDAEPGQTIDLYYWAHLLEDRYLSFAVVPALSTALLTTTPQRTKPPLPQQPPTPSPPPPRTIRGGGGRDPQNPDGPLQR